MPRVGGVVAAWTVLVAALLFSSSAWAEQTGSEEVVDMRQCIALAESLPDFTEKMVDKDKDIAPDFFYFLHVPRVAGRTFKYCFLNAATKPKDRCSVAYDAMRFEGPLEKFGYQCNSQASHDDLSVMELMPENTAVFTQIRDPVSRMLSSYEFSLHTANQRLKVSNAPRDPARDFTVWPWRFLVPLVQQDLVERKEAEAQRPVDPNVWVKKTNEDGEVSYFNKATARSVGTVEEVESTGPDAVVLGDMNPYDNDMVMPLEEFVRLPMVHDLIYNGEAFQVLGFTNISRYEDLGRDLRKCVSGGQPGDKQWMNLKQILIDKSKAVLDKLWHVGVMNDFEGVMASLSALSHWDLEATAYNCSEAARDELKRDAMIVANPEQHMSMVSMSVRGSSMDIEKMEKEIKSAKTPQEKKMIAGKLNKLKRDNAKWQEEWEVMKSVVSLGPDERSKWFYEKIDELFSEEYGKQEGMDVVEAYRQCEHEEKYGSSSGGKVLNNVPDRYGRLVEYSHKARDLIPEEVIEYIKVYSDLDTALMDYADVLYTALKSKQEAAGILPSLERDILLEGSSGSAASAGSDSFRTHEEL